MESVESRLRVGGEPVGRGGPANAADAAEAEIVAHRVVPVAPAQAARAAPVSARYACRGWRRGPVAATTERPSRSKAPLQKHARGDLLADLPRHVGRRQPVPGQFREQILQTKAQTILDLGCSMYAEYISLLLLSLLPVSACYACQGHIWSGVSERTLRKSAPLAERSRGYLPAANGDRKVCQKFAAICWHVAGIFTKWCVDTGRGTRVGLLVFEPGSGVDLGAGDDLLVAVRRRRLHGPARPDRAIRPRARAAGRG